MREGNYREHSGESASAPCVKGTSRRIVVVSAEDHPVYESVIYVVRDDAAVRGVTAQEVLQEAQSALHSRTGVREPEAPSEEARQDAYTVSRILFALSGVVLALSGGILAYWFFAM